MHPVEPRLRSRSVRCGLGEKRDTGLGILTPGWLKKELDDPLYTEGEKAYARVKIEACIEVLKRSELPSGSKMRRVIGLMRALKP